MPGSSGGGRQVCGLGYDMMLRRCDFVHHQYHFCVSEPAAGIAVALTSAGGRLKGMQRSASGVHTIDAVT